MSKKSPQDTSKSAGWLNHTGLHLALLALVMAFLFRDSFKSGLVAFSNDSPLGGQMAQWDYLFTNLTGAWQPLNWFGNESISNRPTISILAGILMGDAIIYQKFFTPFAILLLGAAAYFCFRQLQFRRPVCLIAALAAMLNMSAFSNACWGLPYWCVARAMCFLAIGLVACRSIASPWIRYCLAGACVGMGVMEGYVIGAIFSVFTAAVGLAYIATRPGSPPTQRFLKGGAAVGVMALVAAIIAAHGLVSLINTQVKGVAPVAQSEQAAKEQWDFATRWSLPKMETLRFVIPGLFGYRMDEPDGGQYWGRVGEDPRIPELRQAAQSNPQVAQMLASPSTFRYSGSGEHMGVLVAFLALWAFVASLFREKSPFPIADRRFIWCLTGFALIALGLAWGRYGFLFQFFYELPYATTVRNPIKFTQPMHVAAGILFAYGLNDLWVRFVDNAREKHARVADWWRSLDVTEKNWFLLCGAIAGLSLLSFLYYASEKSAVADFMESTAINRQAGEVIFDFSIGEVMLFLVFLAAGIAMFVLIHRGYFSGPRSKWALGILFCLVLLDLGRSNAHWIRHVDYQQKYASNAVLEKLSETPHEGRVTIAPNLGSQAHAQLQSVYQVNWLHNQFKFFQIQSLDISQESRVGQDKTDYLNHIRPIPGRYWQLAGVRYLLGANVMQTQQGPIRYVDLLNQQLDPRQNRFRNLFAFSIFATPDNPEAQVRVETNGPLAMIEFAGALPRAGVYRHWQTVASPDAALTALKDPALDPRKTLIIDGEMPDEPASEPTEVLPAKIVAYEPKRVVIAAETTGPAVLLLNDRYHPAWRAYIDGKPTEIMRGNFIARAIALPAGAHEVEFRFEPGGKSLYVSLLGLAAIAGLAGFSIMSRRTNPPLPATIKTSPGPGAASQDASATSADRPAKNSDSPSKSNKSKPRRKKR